ncbi:MAG: hypothetical protein N3G20_09010, partial [Verrucomicrobiae bacterium]|nr:hypothetical protein [Verrucomicrobiae bacterium]
VVRQLAVHLGAPANDEEMKRWLALHLFEFGQALDNASAAQYQAQINSLDLLYGEFTYELAGSYEECKALLDTVPDAGREKPSPQDAAESFEELRTWLVERESCSEAGTRCSMTRARILIGPKRWRISVLGTRAIQNLRMKFEGLMGDRVRLVDQRTIDGAKSVFGELPPCEPEKVPAPLLEPRIPLRVSVSTVAVPLGAKEDSDPAATTRLRAGRAWIDTPLDDLGGLTPRQAVSDPQYRAHLVRGMKRLVRECDKENAASRTELDVNWLLTELGLHELVFDPPFLIRNRKKSQ